MLQLTQKNFIFFNIFQKKMKKQKKLINWNKITKKNTVWSRITQSNYS